MNKTNQHSFIWFQTDQILRFYSSSIHYISIRFNQIAKHAKHLNTRVCVCVCVCENVFLVNRIRKRERKIKNYYEMFITKWPNDTKYKRMKYDTTCDDTFNTLSCEHTLTHNLLVKNERIWMNDYIKYKLHTCKCLVSSKNETLATSISSTISFVTVRLKSIKYAHTHTHERTNKQTNTLNQSIIIIIMVVGGTNLAIRKQKVHTKVKIIAKSEQAQDKYLNKIVRVNKRWF